MFRTASAPTGTCSSNLARTPPGVGCIYVKDLQEVDLGVLEAIVTRSYAALTSGTYPNRARDSG
jgi:hypothetical protein